MQGYFKLVYIRVVAREFGVSCEKFISCTGTISTFLARFKLLLLVVVAYTGMLSLDIALRNSFIRETCIV